MDKYLGEVDNEEPPEKLQYNERARSESRHAYRNSCTLCGLLTRRRQVVARSILVAILCPVEQSA